MEITLLLSKLTILQQVEELKQTIDRLRPLSAEQEGRIFQKFRLDWNYHSNAIEGNSLTYGETRALLLYGLTAKGKPLKDHLDVKGHNEAIDFLLALVKDPRSLTEQDIREMHKLVLKEPYRVIAQTEDGKEASKMITLGKYKTSPNHVKTPTGEIHYYATPEETPAKMKDLMDWYQEAGQNSTVHPAILAALFHYRFVAIHPFDDGNGRMARLLMNLILMRYEYPPVVIQQDKNSRNQYYLALSQADAGEYEPFATLVTEALLHSMHIYIKGAQGEDINEPDDLDKELALFRKELEGEKKERFKIRTKETILEIHKSYIHQLLKQIELKLHKFKDLFIVLEQKILVGENSKEIQLAKFHDIYIETINQIYSGENHITIYISYNGFKFGSNTFDYTFFLDVIFEKYEYKIDVTLPKSKTQAFNISKYYHQPITEGETEHFAAKIGQDLLAYIKSQYKNGDHDNILDI